MQFGRALALLLPALAFAANEGALCGANGAWDCGGDASQGSTTILQCSYQTPGTQSLTWTRIATCDGQTPCCDHRAVEMGGVPHCNSRPTAGPYQQWCGLLGPY